MATGEYITFLDSDDGITPDALERMYEEAVKYDADVIHTTGMLIPVARPMPDDLMSLPEDRLCPTTQDKDAPAETTVLSGDIGERMDGWLKHISRKSWIGLTSAAAPAPAPHIRRSSGAAPRGFPPPGSCRLR